MTLTAKIPTSYPEILARISQDPIPSIGVRANIDAGLYTLEQWQVKTARRETLHNRLVEAHRSNGIGDKYFSKQQKHKTPLFFGLYTDSMTGTIQNRLIHDLWVDPVLPAAERQKVSLLDVLWVAKHAELAQVVSTYDVDLSVQDLGLQPIVQREDRPVVDQGAIQRGAEVRVTLRNGAVFSGKVDWESLYNVKLRLETGVSVVLFRHGIYAVEVVAFNAERHPMGDGFACPGCEVNPNGLPFTHRPGCPADAKQDQVEVTHG